MDKYHITGRIGEGAHGVVLLGRMNENNSQVAIKKILIRRIDDGIPVAVLREIKALKQINTHPHVVKLLDVVPYGTGFALVFEYMSSDLQVIMRTHGPLTESQAKSYLVMLLRGITFLHGHGIMHRDLKPANLLIDNVGRLKIADFGLARLFSMDGVSGVEGQVGASISDSQSDCTLDDGCSGPVRPQYSHQVATRWYRAPELLYGARGYDETVDMWAVGCILAEMLNNSPLFPGENDIDQLSCVFRLLGTPTLQSWPSVSVLPDFHKIIFEDMPSVPMSSIVPETSASGVRLLEKLLVFEAKTRLSAAEALAEPYLFLEPLPAHYLELPAHSASDILRGRQA